MTRRWRYWVCVCPDCLYVMRSPWIMRWHGRTRQRRASNGRWIIYRRDRDALRLVPMVGGAR